MLNELKILFRNVKNFRKLVLNEAVGDNKIIDAINDHKILHIYYAGDNTTLKGYRTIRPFVLGTHKSTGNKVLRAWQDAGSSDSYKKPNGVKPRQKHEKHSGPHGIEPGWRLFNMDAITSVMPTGEVYKPENYFVTGDGVNYNPNDRDMSSIDAAISKGLETRKYEPQKQRVRKYVPSREKTREIDKTEVEELAQIAKKHRKKALRYYWVVQNEKGDMVLKPESSLPNIPKEAVVGNLKDLYNKHVVPEIPKSTAFFDKSKNDALKEIEKN